MFWSFVPFLPFLKFCSSILKFFEIFFAVFKIFMMGGQFKVLDGGSLPPSPPPVLISAHGINAICFNAGTDIIPAVRAITPEARAITTATTTTITTTTTTTTIGDIPPRTSNCW